MKHYSKTCIFAVPLAIVLFGAACSRESRQTGAVTTNSDQGTSTAPASRDAEKRDMALVRVIIADPAVPAADVFAGDTKAFDNVAYKSVTPYREMTDSRHTFRLRPANQEMSAPLAENSEGLNGGRHYTVIALPANDNVRSADARQDPAAKVDLKVVNDNITPAEPGKAKVRVIHASPGLGDLDVFERGKKDAVFDGVNFQTEAGYKDLDPYSGTIEVRPDGKQNVLAAIPNARIEPGKIYTIVVMGGPRGKIDAVVVEDELHNMSARR